MNATTATTPHSSRADKVQEARERLDASINLLAEQMAQGKSEQLVRYLEFSARFHTYSLGNLLLILFQRPEATRVAGLRQWNRLGRHVRAGERGIMILAPMSVNKRVKEEEESHGHDRKSDEQDEGEVVSLQKVTLFKPVYVFDVTQTDGAELPSLLHAAGDVSVAYPALCQAIRDTGINLEIKDSVPGCPSAHGASFGGRIVVREDLEGAEAFRTLAHEWSHEILHWPKNGSPKEPDKTVRETEADATAFVVCRHFGVTCDSADYLLLYDAQAKTLLERLQTVKRTATRIIEGILKSLRT